MTIVDEQIHAWQLLKSGDYEAAEPLLKSMAERNSHYAMLCLGWLYDSGKVGDPDPEIAKFYYKMVADAGVNSGRFELARVLYDEGQFVDSRKLFAEGKEDGCIQCLAWLGTMMARGEGGGKNTEEALILLERAASEGQLIAIRNLLLIKIQKSRSPFARIRIYFKILCYSFVAGYEYWKDPYSIRGYR